MRTTPIINSLVGGVISPRLAGRSDIQQYFQSAEDLLNTIVECYGGGKNRAGFRFIAETKDSTKASRNIPFNFNDSQAYNIELGNYYMRFYRLKAQIIVTSAAAWVTSTGYVVGNYVSTGSPSVIYYCLVAHTSGTFATDLAAGKWVAQTIYEIPSPYAEADIGDVQIKGSADIAYLFHPKYPIYKLSRTGHTSWTLAAVDFSAGSNRPALMPTNKTSITITPATVSGASISLTASSALFDTSSPSKHIGSIWKINTGKSVSATTWASSTVYAAGAYVTYDSEIYFCRANHTSGTSFLNDMAAGNWSHQNIYAKITAVSSNTVASATVLYGDLLEPTPAATTDWNEGAWSTYRGYPRCGTFNEQRLMASSTDSQPQTVWGSKTLEYENFGLGSDDADSLDYTINTDQVETIKWLFPLDQLAIGTSGGVHALGSGSSVTPLTPTNVIVRKQTTYGVRGTEPVNPGRTIPPIGIGSYAYYFQKYGRKLRELVYNVNTDKFEAADATILAEHITESGAVDMAYQQEPDNILWCVLANGKLAAYTRQIEQKVQAWTPHDTDGWFESINVIPGETEDEVWVIVKREINGTMKRYVEVLESRVFEEQEDWFFVDSGLSLDNPKVITGATAANPVVITAIAHGFSNGNIVKIRGVEGMVELNYKKFKVANKTNNTFELQTPDGVNVNGIAFTAYESAGEVRKCFTTISGLGHLEGKEVAILVDGATHPKRTVVSASIVLADEYSQANVGLSYKSKILTNDLEGGGSQGTSQSKKRRIAKIAIRFLESVGCKFGNTITQDTLVFRSSAMKTDKSIAAYTGDKGPIGFPDGWSRKKQIEITQEEPLPMHVLAIIPDMETND